VDGEGMVIVCADGRGGGAFRDSGCVMRHAWGI